MVPLAARLGTGARRPYARGAAGGAAAGQATVSPEEADEILLTHDRLDGWMNVACRCLKTRRDGRGTEAHLDAVEALPWLLDVVWTLAGRVRPDNKYLLWELRAHPLPGWDAALVQRLVEGHLTRDAAAVRAAYGLVRERRAADDAARERTTLVEVLDGWGEELALFPV